MATKSCNVRRGMTLVELLVVMVIMLILATIVVAFAPGFQDAQKVARGADQLQQWLLTARQWAKKDRVPTGLRLSITNGFVTDLQYVQQPATFTVPYAVPALGPGQQPDIRRISVAPLDATHSTASVDPVGTVPLTTGQAAGDFRGLEAGDFLVIHGSIYSVAAIVSNSQLTLGGPLPANITLIPPTTDYYFVRAPRPLTGESTLKLPQDVAIDMGQSDPRRTTEFDILFSPSGEVLSPVFGTTKGGKVILWVLDVTKPAGNKDDSLIAVDMRTGMIAAQPVNVGGTDPYLYTRDGRSSGL